MLFLPRPLPNEVIKGDHFVLVDLLKSLPGGFSQAEAVLKPLVWTDYLPLVVQDPKPTPQVVKKKSEQVKAANDELEGFVEWTNMVVRQSIEEREVEMYGLVTRFATWMRKRATNA